MSSQHYDTTWSCSLWDNVDLSAYHALVLNVVLFVWFLNTSCCWSILWLLFISIKCTSEVVWMSMNVKFLLPNSFKCFRQWFFFFLKRTSRRATYYSLISKKLEPHWAVHNQQLHGRQGGDGDPVVNKRSVILECELLEGIIISFFPCNNPGIGCIEEVPGAKVCVMCIGFRHSHNLSQPQRGQSIKCALDKGIWHVHTKNLGLSNLQPKLRPSLKNVKCTF